MPRISMVLIVMTLCIGCASPYGGDEVLYKRYLLYAQESVTGDAEGLAERYFSESMFENVDTKDRAAAGKYLSTHLATVFSHYERLEGRVGCIAINGFDSDGEPVVVSLLYRNERDIWLVDQMHIAFVEGADRFSSESICPDEVPAKLFVN